MENNMPHTDFEKLKRLLQATNKWRFELWALRAYTGTPPELQNIAKMLMERQQKLEDEAMADI